MSDTKTADSTRVGKLDALREKIAGMMTKVRDAEVKLVKSKLDVARVLVKSVAPLFSADEKDAYETWACDATGWDKTTLRNNTKAVKVRDSLADEDRATVDTWAIDAIYSLAPIGEGMAETATATIAVLAEDLGADVKPSGKEVRTARDTVLDKPEKPKRKRSGDAEETVALADALAEKVLEWAAGPIELAMVNSARLVTDAEDKRAGSGRLIPDAIGHILSNREKYENDNDK